MRMPILPNQVKCFFAAVIFFLFVFPSVARSGDGVYQPNRKADVIIDYYFTPGCRLCKDTTDIVERVAQRYMARVQVNRYNMRSGANVVQSLFQRLDQAGVAETKSLVAFVNTQCLSGGETIINELSGVVAEELKKNSVIHPPSPKDASSEQASVSHESTDRTGFWVISVAALADGVNPCAFATVVLFVSMLNLIGTTRKAILGAGIAFGSAVFLTYLALGVFLFEIFSYLLTYQTLSSAITWFAIGLVVILGGLSFYDALQIYLHGASNAMLLQLPRSIKNRMRRMLRKGTHAASLYLGVFAAGVVVALLESFCTGQIYLPVISGLVRDGSTRLSGMLYLVWYNILFVLPLALVFGLVFFGVKSERIGQFSRSHAVATKILLGSVFWGMAIWLLRGLHVAIPFFE